MTKRTNRISVKVKSLKPDYIAVCFGIKDIDKGIAVSFRTKFKNYDDYLDIIEDVGNALADHVVYLRTNKAEYETN